MESRSVTGRFRKTRPSSPGVVLRIPGSRVQIRGILRAAELQKSPEVGPPQQEQEPPLAQPSRGSGTSRSSLRPECRPPSGLSSTTMTSVDFTNRAQSTCYAEIGQGALRHPLRCSATPRNDPNLPIYAFFFPSSVRRAATALVLGGVHGNEIPGYQMASAMGAELARSPSASSGGAVLRYHTIVIPCVNPGGVTDNRRCNRRDVDINRNFVPHSGSHRACRCTPTAPLQPETRAVQAVIGRFIGTGRGDRILSGHSVGSAQAGVFVDPNYQIASMDLARQMASQGRLPSNWMQGNTLPSRSACRRRSAPRHLCHIRAHCDNNSVAIPVRTLTRHPALRDPRVLAWVCRHRFYPTYASDRFGLYPQSGSLGHYMGQPGRRGVPVVTIETPGAAALGGRGRPPLSAYLRLIRYFLSGAPASQLSQPLRR